MGATGEILHSTNDWVSALLGETNQYRIVDLKKKLNLLIITLSVRKLNKMCALALCNFNFLFKFGYTHSL